MTDYFALLDQPRRPWLDPKELKQAFHRKSLRTHPDSRAEKEGASAAGQEFTELNKAYQALQDPKRRLQHLLELEGTTPVARSTAVPQDIERLFPAVAALTQQAHSLAEKNAQATNPLTRSLIKPQLLQVHRELAETLAILQKRHAEAVARLQQLASVWEQARLTSSAELRDLYLRFSYLSRWITELQEKQVQLSAL